MKPGEIRELSIEEMQELYALVMEAREKTKRVTEILGQDLMLQIDLSNIENVERFEQALGVFGEESGLRLAVQHNDIFRATNEI